MVMSLSPAIGIKLIHSKVWYYITAWHLELLVLDLMVPSNIVHGDDIWNVSGFTTTVLDSLQ